MQEKLRLLVLANEIGLLVDTDEGAAPTEIVKAREVLSRLAQGTSRSRVRPRQAATTISERILSLGIDFFVEPKDSMEISKQLARAAFHYEPVRVRDELRRMVGRGQLRRLGDGTRGSPYKYVNP